MARTNFKYEKRQKELAKQAKAEEKRLRKLEKRNQTDDAGMVDAEDADNPSARSVDEAVSEQESDSTG